MKRPGSLLAPLAVLGLAFTGGCTGRVVVVEERRPPPRREVFVEEEVVESPGAAEVEYEPPAPRREVVIIESRPSPGYVWAAGHWSWQGRWVWIGGHWVRCRVGYHRWIPGHWEVRGRHWAWIPGHWD
jgi:hypothetical protein